MVRIFRILLALLLWLTGVAAAQQQDVVPEFCEGDPECIQHYNSARFFSTRNQTQAAISEYKAANARKPFSPLLFNIARLYDKSGKLGEAIQYYNEYLHSPLAGDASQREYARQYIAEAITQLPPNSIVQPVQDSIPPIQLRAQAADKPGSGVQPLAGAPRRPLYKKWWFWTVVGVVAAGAATGAALGVYAQRPDITQLPSTTITIGQAP